jgi:3',5'-nucleoside bisphosphate phosphatase
MKEFRADLHCHTTCSDGSLTPVEVIKLAAEIGLKGLSITDHDTIDGYETALPAAKEAGVELLPGVEFSAAYRDVSVHILAYAFSLSDEHILTFCQRHQARREQRNRAILKLLQQNGIPITEEELLGGLDTSGIVPHKTIGRPHIALAMVRRGYVSSVQDAFAKYLKEGKSCYSPGEPFSVEETIDIIHRAKGVAIIAHPHLIAKRSVARYLLQLNFDGLEAYYARLPVEREAEWIKTAQAKGWLITGGSDFHGSVKPNIPLGCSWVNEETFRRLSA